MLLAFALSLPAGILADEGHLLVTAYEGSKLADRSVEEFNERQRIVARNEGVNVSGWGRKRGDGDDVLKRIRDTANGEFVLRNRRLERQIAAMLRRRTWRESAGGPLKQNQTTSA